MTRIGELAALVVILTVSAMPAFAGDAQGWYDYCCSTTDFHFTEFPGQTSGDELRLELDRGPLPLVADPEIWWGHVKGKRCAQSGKCEEATKADIQIIRATKRRLFGKYIADFNGQHFEGQFSVKYRKRHPLCICE